VSQAGSYVPDVQSLRDHDRRGGVPEAVKGNGPEAVRLDNLLKLLGWAGDVQSATCRSGEYRIRFGPIPAESQPIFRLLFAVLLEDGHDGGRQVDQTD